jgi:hypothetical protein
MPNTNAPSGFKPVKYASGACYAGGGNIYHVPAADATALFIGDPVILAGSADANGVATVTKATVGGRVTGIVVGIIPAPNLLLTYRPASTAAYVVVADDPNLIFEVQEDAVGGALAAVDVGLNADMILGAGAAATGMSGTQLDTSTKAALATLGWRIEGFVQRPDNEIGVNAKVLVRNNLPTGTGASGSLGV